MSVPAAYLGVILIWTTTPLAIQWSSDGPGFLFGVASRMLLAAILALAVAALLGKGMRWDKPARRAYLVAGLSIFGAMTCVYWSAQFIPSGWIAVVFGLAPIITGLCARLWLGDRNLGPRQFGGMLLAVTGLGVMFGGSLEISGSALLGLLGVLTGAAIHGASSVALKRIDAHLPGIVMAAGGLLVAAPLFALNWALNDGQWPVLLPAHALGAILYLAVFGSVLGFALFYYVLHHLAPTTVALITLITPVGALLLGNLIQDEPITTEVMLGTGLILAGLALYQLAGRKRPARTLAEAPAEG